MHEVLSQCLELEEKSRNRPTNLIQSLLRLAFSGFLVVKLHSFHLLRHFTHSLCALETL